MVRAAARTTVERTTRTLVCLCAATIFGCSEGAPTAPATDERPARRVRERAALAASPPGSEWGAETMIVGPVAFASFPKLGKVGVLCLAPRPGLGVTDPQARARVGEERLRLFRR